MTTEIVYGEAFINTLPEIEEALKRIAFKIESIHTDFYETHRIIAKTNGLQITFWFSGSPTKECVLYGIFVSYQDLKVGGKEHQTEIFCDSVNIFSTGAFTKCDGSLRFTSRINWGLV